MPDTNTRFPVGTKVRVNHPRLDDGPDEGYETMVVPYSEDFHPSSSNILVAYPERGHDFASKDGVPAWFIHPDYLDVIEDAPAVDLAKPSEDWRDYPIGTKWTMTDPDDGQEWEWERREDGYYERDIKPAPRVPREARRMDGDRTFAHAVTGVHPYTLSPARLPDAEAASPVVTTAQPKRASELVVGDEVAMKPHTKNLRGSFIFDSDRVYEVTGLTPEHTGRKDLDVVEIAGRTAYRKDILTINGHPVVPEEVAPTVVVEPDRTYTADEVKQMVAVAELATKAAQDEWLQKMGRDAILFAIENEMCGQAEVFLNRWDIPHPDRESLNRRETTVTVTFTLSGSINGDDFEPNVDATYAKNHIERAMSGLDRNDLIPSDYSRGEVSNVAVEVADWTTVEQ